MAVLCSWRGGWHCGKYRHCSFPTILLSFVLLLSLLLRGGLLLSVPTLSSPVAALLLILAERQPDQLRIVHPALLVDRPADPRAIAGQDRPETGELGVGAVALDQL